MALDYYKLVFLASINSRAREKGKKRPGIVSSLGNFKSTLNLQTKRMKIKNTGFVTKRGTIRKPQLNSSTDNQRILEITTVLSLGRLIPYFDAMVV